MGGASSKTTDIIITVKESSMEVLDVNEIPTHVFRLKHRRDTASKSLALVIPGSPGMGHFYIPFATRLFQLGGGSYDIALVSHAGHSPGFLRPTTVDCHKKARDFPGNLVEKPEATITSMPNTGGDGGNGISSLGTTQHSSTVSEDRDWYCLEEQIAHKLAFIEQYASHADTIYLIGHSIGSWIVLQMMKILEPSKVKKAFLLFPTIELMGETPKGILLAPLFSSLRLPFTFGVWCLSWIPDAAKRFLLKHHFYTTPEDQVRHMTQGAINIDSKAIHNVLCMAKQEIAEVTLPPLQVIDANIGKIVFYYGIGDKWNIDSCYSNMCERYPDHEEVHRCKQGYAHAFVESSSNEMAEFVFSKIMP